MESNKYCPHCKQFKSIEQFGKSSRYVDNRRTWCKSCENESKRQRRGYAQNSTYLTKYHEQQARSAWLKFQFNISLEDYEVLHKQQNGLCAICGQSETTKHKSGKTMYLAVDHNHTTGKVRGLLCRSCNIRLGVLENTTFIEQARMYLAKYQ